MDHLTSRLDRHARATTRTPDPGLARMLLAAADPLGSERDTEALRAAATMRSGSNRGADFEVPLAMLRDQTTTGTAGGYMIGNSIIAPGASLLGAGVVDLVTRVQLERGAPSVPIVSTVPSAAWISTDGGAAAQSEPVFGSVAVTPCTVGVFANASLRLMKQSPIADALVRREINAAVERALTAAITAGSGSSGQPQGLANNGSVVTMSGTSLTFATIIDNVTTVLATGAKLGDLAFVVGTTAWKLLAKREKAAGSGFVICDGAIANVPVVVSPDVGASALFLGPWQEIVLTTWGGLDLLVDPRSAASGVLRFNGLLDAAVSIRRPGSFVYSATVT